MEAYKTWVRRKKNYVRPLESLANGFTWLLPERFCTSEIGPEAGFVKHWVIVRLALFRNCGYKMLLQGGRHQMLKKILTTQVCNMNCGFPKAWRPSRTLLVKKQSWSKPIESSRKGISVLSRFVGSARMISDPVWRQRIKQQHAIMEPPSDYFVKILLYGNRLSIPCYKLREGGKEQQFHLFASEKNEVKRRKLLWALYLMRELFFNKYPRHKLESTEKLLESVPLAGTLAAKIVELVIGAQTRYTYMSGA